MKRYNIIMLSEKGARLSLQSKRGSIIVLTVRGRPRPGPLVGCSRSCDR